jgi:predicted esterase
MILVRKWWLWIIFILIAGVIFSPPITNRLNALSVTFNLLVPAGNWRPLELFTEAPAKKLQAIQSASGRALDIHIYTPIHKADTAMIIYTPFIGGGLDDPRLVNLAKTFSRAGFIVAIPARKEETLIVSQKDVIDIISTATFLKNEIDIRKIGFFGISYGNGPVIVASTNPQIKDLVNFVVSFAGYYDLQNALDFIRTGEFSYQNIRGKIEPHDYAKEILGKTIASYNMREEEFVKSEAWNRLRKELSPAEFINEIKAEFFITHSTDDQFIPYTESLRLADALRDKMPVWLALNTAFEHGSYKKLSLENLRQHYFPSFISFYKMVQVLLAMR